MKNQNKRFWYKLFCAVFFLIIIAQPLLMLYKNSETFFSGGYTARYNLFKNLYYNSQYVKKDKPGIIPDQALEAYAAGAFLKGINPILIIHDQPPLGRYILSLSISLFDNPNTIMVFLLFVSGLGLFLVAKLVLKNTFLSLLPLTVFINEPLSLNKFLNTPLLEPIQLPFIIFALYFFIQGVVKKSYVKWFILTSVMLGFVISIRFFVLGAVLVSAMILYFLINKQSNNKFFVFLLTLPIALIVLFASYARTIQLGSSILHILGIQKYIYNYHRLQLSLPFSFWDLILFNRWHTWWGTRAITSDPQWIIIWPVSMVLTFIYFLAGAAKKISISEQEKIILIWVSMYSLFLSFGQTSTRYFPPLLPFIYIITISFLKKTYEKIFI